MVSLYGHATNLVFRLMPQDKPGQPHDYEAERKRNDRKPPRPPKGVTVEKIQLDGLEGEYIRKPGNKGVIFYIHGGGFTVGSARERRTVCQYIAAHHGCNCVTFNYRLAPENLWPAPLEDSLKAYRALPGMGIDPSKVILMGESAGGTLVLSLALLLKEQGLPQPKGIVALSPSVTMAETLPSHVNNAKTDYMLRRSVAQGAIKIVFGDRREDMYLLRQPTVSPLYGDYSGLPPVCFSVSDTEALYDDSILLYEKLQKEGHPTVLNVEHGVCHAFQVFPDMPEARHALKEIFRSLEEYEDEAGI